MNLHIELSKRDELINKLKEGYKIFKENEYQYRMMMALYEDREKRIN